MPNRKTTKEPFLSEEDKDFLREMLTYAALCAKKAGKNRVFSVLSDALFPKKSAASPPVCVGYESAARLPASKGTVPDKLRDTAVYCSARELLSLCEQVSLPLFPGGKPAFRFVYEAPLPIGLTLWTSPFAFYFILLFLLEKEGCAKTAVPLTLSVRAEARTLAVRFMKAPSSDEKAAAHLPFLKKLARAGNITLEESEENGGVFYRLSFMRSDEAAFSLLQVPKQRAQGLCLLFCRACGIPFPSEGSAP